MYTNDITSLSEDWDVNDLFTKEESEMDDTLDTLDTLGPLDSLDTYDTLGSLDSLDDAAFNALTFDNGCELTFVEYSQQTYDMSFEICERSSLESVEGLIRTFPIDFKSVNGNIKSFKQRSTLIKDEIAKIINVNDRSVYLNLYREFLFDYDYTMLKKDIDTMITKK